MTSPKVKLVRRIGGQPLTLSDGRSSKDYFEITLTYVESPEGPEHTTVFRLPRGLAHALRLSLDQTWTAPGRQPPGSESHH